MELTNYKTYKREMERIGSDGCAFYNGGPPLGDYLEDKYRRGVNNQMALC